MTTSITRPCVGWATALGAVLFAACIAGAQMNPASEAIPADALIAIEWTGAHSLTQSTGAKTPFQQWIERDQTRSLFESLRDVGKSLLARNGQQTTAEQVAITQAAETLLAAAWEHGLSAALLDVAMGPTGPSPAVVVAIPAGESCDPVMAAATQALGAMLGEPTEATISGRSMQRFNAPLPVHVGCVDGMVIVTLGEQASELAIETLGGARLALHTAERLTSAMNAIAAGNSASGGAGAGSVHQHLLFRVFIDAARIRERAVETYATMSGGPLPEPIAQMLERMGVMSLESITMTETIAGGAHRHSLYVASPGPKRALLKLFNADPITDADLAAVSADAAFAVAVNLRADEIYDDWLQAAESLAALDPSLPDVLRGAIALLNERMGLRIREDVIAALGETWVVFDAPSHGGLPVGSGTTLVVDVKDVDRAGALMDKALQTIGASLTGSSPQPPRDLIAGDRRVRYVQLTGMPAPVAPAWGFTGQRMVIAMYPQLVLRTLERLSSPSAASRSILENTDFLRARKSMPAANTMMVYLDSSRAAKQWYRITLPLMTAALSAAAEQAPSFNVAMWPNMDALTAELFGEAWAASKDKNGVLIVGQGPWPVPIVPIDALGPFALAGALPALLGAGNVGWPGQGRAPATFDDMPLDEPIADAMPPAEDTPSTTATSTAPDPESYVREKLESLGTHCQLYAMENQEAFPPDLKSLVGRHGLKPDTLATPAGIDAEFHYIAGQTIRAEPTNVLIYCTVDDTGGWVLNVDGELHRHDASSLQRVVDETMRRIAEANPKTP